MPIIKNMEPELSLKLNVKYINVDKFGKCSFGLTEEVYNKLKDKLLEGKPDKYCLPISTYEFNGVRYWNLKVKKSSVPDELVEEPKHSNMEICVDFIPYTFMKNEGMRAVVTQYRVVEEKKVIRKYTKLEE